MRWAIGRVCEDWAVVLSCCVLCSLGICLSPLMLRLPVSPCVLCDPSLLSLCHSCVSIYLCLCDVVCRETTEGLGRMIARELQPPVLADKLDLSEVGGECVFGCLRVGGRGQRGAHRTPHSQHKGVAKV